MNQIDYNIPFKSQPLKLPNIGGYINDAVTLGNMLEDRDIKRQERAIAERDRQENEHIKSLIPRYLDSEFNGDRKGLIAEVMRINPNKAQQMIDGFNGMDKQRMDQQKAADAIRMRDEGRGKLAQYQGDITRYNQVQNERMPEPPADRVGPLTRAEQGAVNTNALIDKVKKPYFENLVPYESYTPEIRSMIDYGLANKRIDTSNKALGRLNDTEKLEEDGTFKENTKEYELANKIATDRMTWDQGLQLFVGFGNKTGKRENLAYTVYKINPDYKTSTGVGQYRADILGAQIPAKAQTSFATAGATEKGKREAGLTLSETASERLGDFGASLGQLGVLTESFSNPDAPQGPISQIRKANPYDWQAQAKQQLIAATKQLIGKALEGGVLRKEDEDKYDKILPVMGDTYQSAIAKSQNIAGMLDIAYKAKKGALKNAGYAIDNFPSSYNKSEAKTSFNSIQEAEAANLPKGTLIYINGRKAVVE